MHENQGFRGFREAAGKCLVDLLGDAPHRSLAIQFPQNEYCDLTVCAQLGLLVRNVWRNQLVLKGFSNRRGLFEICLDNVGVNLRLSARVPASFIFVT
ncbi:MAG: hypothetical protein ABUK16_11350 [Anaerolineales bacterium]